MPEQEAPAVARPVVLFDDLPLDASRLVEHEGHRISDAVLLRPGGDGEPGVMHLEIFVEDPKFPNDAAAFVGQDRVVDALLVGECFQIDLAVIGDREDGIAGPFELLVHALQLDQLRLAVRSPDRAAVEDDDRAPAPAAPVQIHQLPTLVRQANARERPPDLWTTPPVIGLGHHVAR